MARYHRYGLWASELYGFGMGHGFSIGALGMACRTVDTQCIFTLHSSGFIGECYGRV